MLLSLDFQQFAFLVGSSLQATVCSPASLGLASFFPRLQTHLGSFQPGITPALFSTGTRLAFLLPHGEGGMLGPLQPTLHLDCWTSCPLTSLLQPGGQKSTAAPSVL